MKNQRRRLCFERLEDAVVDAENLLTTGYHKAGNWDLTQCCRHLTAWMSYPIDGFPRFPLPMRIANRIARHTMASRMLKKILAAERWPDRTPTHRDSVVVETGRDGQAVAELKDAVDRLLSHDGPWKPSPLLGLLDKDTLIKLHRIHTAHHLGFLVPIIPPSETT